MKLAIATPFYSMNGFVPYISSLIATSKVLEQAKIEWEFWDYSGDAYVDRARNTLCARFYNSNCTDLLFIDSDMAWDMEGLCHILKSPMELTGGAYPTKNNYEKFTSDGIIYDEDHAPVQDEQTGLIETKWLSGGFLRISKSCIEKMYKAYKDNWYWETTKNEKSMQIQEKIIDLFGMITEDNLRLGEDVSFCKRWLEIGGKCWLEPRISFGHCGMKTWDGNFHEYFMAQATIERINRNFNKINEGLRINKGVASAL